MPDLNQLLETLLRALPDINQPLETLLRAFEAGEVTNLFLWLLSGILLLAIVSKSKWFGWFPRFTVYAPTFLTSLGIFGTFVGIVIGLVDFDPNQIDKSVRDLLEGLKTAFISSIVGLGYSLFFKFLTTTFTSLFPDSEEGDKETQSILDALNKQTQLLEATQKAIAGAGDEGLSLIRQVGWLRQEHRALHQAFTAFTNQLWQKLDEFAKTMSRSATEQVIEALQKVITDFNKNLTEQFGDNFKELNDAVKKLVEWQENYRKRLEQIHKRYEEVAAAITLIEQRCALIPQSMKQLEPIIKTASHQIDELGRHLAVFEEMRQNANDAIPEVAQFSNEMQKAVTKTMQEMGTQLAQISGKFVEDYQELTNAMADVVEQARAFNQERGDNR